jgi:hypothetical protein
MIEVIFPDQPALPAGIPGYVQTSTLWKLCHCAASANAHYHATWVQYAKQSEGAVLIRPDKPVTP